MAEVRFYADQIFYSTLSEIDMEILLHSARCIHTGDNEIEYLDKVSAKKAFCTLKAIS